MNKALEKNTIENFDIIEKYTLTFENKDIENDNNKINDVVSDAISLDNMPQDQIETCTSLVPLKERRLFVAQNMFKKSIRVSLKSFLISISLSFLNLFI